MRNRKTLTLSCCALALFWTGCSTDADDSASTVSSSLAASPSAESTDHSSPAASPSDSTDDSSPGASPSDSTDDSSPGASPSDSTDDSSSGAFPSDSTDTDGSEPSVSGNGTAGPSNVQKSAQSEPGLAAPGAPKPGGKQSDVFARVPGSTSSDCVVVGDRRDVQSGGIVGGPFDDAKASYGTKRPGLGKNVVRLYWIPLNSKKMPGVTVKATNLSSGESTEVTRKAVADAEQWKFYDTELPLDSPGTWRFVVASGPDRGCFELDFS